MSRRVSARALTQADFGFCDFSAGWPTHRGFCGCVGKEIGVNKRSIKSDLGRIDRMKDSEIDYSDIPRLDKTFLKKATMAWPPAKKQLTIRLDEDVLDWHDPNN